jgi:hypothetical protein
VHANGDPLLPAKEVIKRGEVFMQWRMWRWSYLPLLLFIFILLFVITS